MGILSVFRRKPKRDLDAERRELLASHGRITDGLIVDTETEKGGREIVFYRYTLNGVDFESSEILSAEQASDPLKYAPGAKVGVLYDPKNQGNSMLQ